LQRLLDRAGPAACYCDTDSVYAELPADAYADCESRNLGDVKCEAEYERVHFAAPKTYVKVLAKPNKRGETKEGKAKGLRAKGVDDVEKFVAGEKVEQRRVLGLFEVRRRYGEQRLVSEVSEKRAQHWSERRNGDRAYTTTELRDKGVIE
jgi:hypothetical protein